MRSLRDNLENKLSLFGCWVFDNPVKLLSLLLVLFLGLISQLPRINIDISNEGFLHKDDPILISYNSFRDQFGRDDIILLAIETPEIFEETFLNKLSDFHHELEEELPFLDDVKSLINVRTTLGSGDTLIVEDLFKIIPKTPKEMEFKKIFSQNNELYKNFILSEDANFTTIIIRSNAYSYDETELDINELEFDNPSKASNNLQTNTVLTDTQNTQVINKVRGIIEKYQSQDFKIYAAGSPIVINSIKQSMQNDMKIFVKLALLMIIITLAILFRRISGVILPILVVLLTLLSTISMMAISGTAIKLPTQILPLFLLAVSVAASVHILTIFFRSFNKSGNKRAAISYSLGHSGLAVIMTSLTTAAGLLSFSTSEVAPIADLGLFAAFGVTISLLYTLILIPALLALLPIKQKHDQSTKKRAKVMDKALENVSNLSTKYSKSIVGIAAIILIFSIFGLTKLEFKHDPLTWLPESWDVRQSTDLIDVKMGGTNIIEVVVDTGMTNGLYEPTVMNGLEKLHSKIEKLTVGDMYVGKTVSVVNILKESNKALHQNQDQYYEIPQNRDLIAQELFLFENSGSDDLEDFVDSQFSMARITIKTPWSDAATNTLMIELLESELKNIFDNKISSHTTGMASLFSRTMNASINGIKKSYLIATFVILIMMIIFLGNFKLGIISMIPNLLPIFISLSILGYAGIPIDMFTMIIGSISIGLVVDDTIHFMHNFRRYYLSSGDVNYAVKETLATTGRAIVVTTIVLCLGFFIFLAASMENLFRFGLITGITIFLALLGDLLLAPALMKLFYGKDNEYTQSNTKLDTRTKAI